MEKNKFFARVAVSACLLFLLALSCLWIANPQQPYSADTPSELSAGVTPALPNLSVDQQADLPKKLQPTLRVLYSGHGRDGYEYSEKEQQLIQKFADEQGLELSWKKYEEPWELLPALYQNQGDIILSQNHEVAGGLQGVVNYTVPWSTISVQLLAYDNDVAVDSLSDLKGRQIVVKRSQIQSGLFGALNSLKENNHIEIIDENQSPEQTLKKLTTGEYDLVVMSSDVLARNKQQYPDTRPVYTFNNSLDKVWAVQKTNKDLITDLNTFLISELFLQKQNKQQPRDFNNIKDSGVLRVISYLSPTNMYYQDGDLNGFEYDFLKAFAEQHKLDLAIVFAHSHDELFELLQNGTGDVVAASVNDTENKNPLLGKSLPYAYSTPVIVSRKGDYDFIDIHDLEGKTISLPAESQYFNYLKEIKNKSNVRFNIEVVDDSINTEALLFMVSIGIKDYTVVNSNNLVSEFSRQINLKANLQLGTPNGIVWYTRNENSHLLSEMNDFISKEYRKLRYNELKTKYVNSPAKARGDNKLLTTAFNLTPYDGFIKKYSDKHGFDWRLIAAQIYQESQFDPEAVSYMGAQGLMQIMPETADELGLDATEDPNENIEAGVRYLANLRDRFAGDITVIDQLWFALAAYNAGYNRVVRTRKLAVRMGLDENKWFNNVEVAMKGLSSHKKKDNTAYCRCGQTVVYVRDIRTRYENYIAVSNRANTTVFVDSVINDLMNYN